MCGIFGYLGKRRNAIPVVIKGIHKLEYRGYDSAGVVTISNGKLEMRKVVGKVDLLDEAVFEANWKRSQIAIGHTRWATHGRPTVANAHPHVDDKMQIAVVHNGIIENYEAIRRLLIKKGISFKSDTDTEVVSQLIGYVYKGNFLRAVQWILPFLKGAFAIAAVHQDHPGEIVCAAKESPLAIGLGDDEMFIASSAEAFSKYTRKAIYLRGSEVALVTRNAISTFDSHLIPITKECEELGEDAQEVSKGRYQHFMLKEIFEQPQTIQNALFSRYSEKHGSAILDELCMTEQDLLNIQRIVILACGTSYHAGLAACLMLEEYARIPVQVEISSEFRYKNPILLDNTLVIAISQSGETADTLAALRELREKGAKILGICNVLGSTLAREVDKCLFLRAGPEIGVASTKAFTSQITVMALLTLFLGRVRQIGLQQGQTFIDALTKLPEQIKKILAQSEVIRHLAKKYALYDNFFFLGRRYMFPTALEAALKLKEIAYINANGYPAGEMKHGPIALINEQCPTLAFCADSVTYPKMLSNLMEVKARSGKILAVAFEGAEDVANIADDVFWIPKTLDPLAIIPATVAFGQLFPYYVALERGTEIDQPRNLAKSVTVE